MARRCALETALTPRETVEALCRGARPWSLLDRWTARNTWFARAQPDGLRLVRTGPIGGYVQADAALTAVEGGTRIKMTVRLPAGFFLFHGFFWLALILLIWADGFSPHTLCYACLPLFSLWQWRSLTALLPEVEHELRARVQDHSSH